MSRLSRFVLAWGLACTAFVAPEARADESQPSTPLAPALVLPAPPSLAKRRLSDEDIERKEDGGYFTGVPLLAYDPNFGFGLGARVYYYYDGHQDDPLYDYTPYLHRVFAQAFATTGGAQDHLIDYDAPA